MIVKSENNDKKKKYRPIQSKSTCTHVKSITKGHLKFYAEQYPILTMQLNKFVSV